MNTIVNDKQKLDDITSKIVDGTVIRIFDFDGTLFNSPIPNPNLWDSKMIGKLMGETHRGGLGWFQNPITLNDEYIVNSTFNEDVVSEALKSIADPDSITVMLTGRTSDYAYQIKSILDSNNLYFDHYGFKPARSELNVPTMQFKQQFIKDLIDEYQPDAIEFLEDRYKHVKKFKEFIDELGLKGDVHFVQESPCYMPEKSERKLVELLKGDSDNSVNSVNSRNSGNDTMKNPIYYGAFLYSDDHYALLDQLKDSIPEGWKTFAHHMTLLFGKNKNADVEQYIKANMGKDVTLKAVKLGVSDDAIAVQIESDVPTDNKFPHITIAVPPGGKPFNSNNISNWEPLSHPISVIAKIGAFYG